MANNSEQLEALASEIGDKIYIDVAKWHLYLKEAKLHTVLAEKAYPFLAAGNVTGDKVNEILGQVIVPLGGGRKEVPLSDLLPVACSIFCKNLRGTHRDMIDLVDIKRDIGTLGDRLGKTQDYL
jgi:hypothetical protein